MKYTNTMNFTKIYGSMEGMLFWQYFFLFNGGRILFDNGHLLGFCYFISVWWLPKYRLFHNQGLQFSPPWNLLRPSL